MKHEIEITLISTADIGLHFLWEKVFEKIHLALHDTKKEKGRGAIGLSIPEYSEDRHHLGSKIRLFSIEKAEIEALKLNEKLSNSLDYVHLTNIREVPENIKNYASYKRQQPKSSIERFARRDSKRFGISEIEALERLQRYSEKRVKTPFINIKSNHSEPQHRFKLFIKKQESSELIEEGFTSYGLSSRSTVPEF